MTNQSCGTCWHLRNRDEEQKLGQCCRYPPRPMVVGMVQAPGNTLRTNPMPPQPAVQSPFPVMQFEAVCGEWKAEGRVLDS